MSMVKYVSATRLYGLALTEPLSAANVRADLFDKEAARLEAAAADYRRMAQQMRESGRPDAAGV